MCAERFTRFWSIAFLVGALPGLCLGETYHVSTQGNDGNSGLTESEPFQTIPRALRAVRAGDTIFLRGGSYPGFRIREMHFPEDNRVTMRSYPGETAVIDGALGQGNSLRISGASGWVFQDFEVTNSWFKNDDSHKCDTQDPECISRGKNIGTHMGVLIDGVSHSGLPANSRSISHHLRFLRLKIYSNGGHGILAGHSSYNFEVIDCELSNNGVRGLAQGYGTYIDGDSHVIRGNRVFDNSGNGLRLGNTGPLPGFYFTNGIVEDNIIYDNGGKFLHTGSRTGFYDSGAGIVIWGGHGNLIRNNVVYRNRGPGIQVNSRMPHNNRVFNNTVFGNGEYGLLFYDNHAVIYSNNISYRNNYRRVFRSDREGVGNHGATNLLGDLVDPLFANPAQGDFRLQPGSPARNAGSSLGGRVGNDVEGVRRPQGSALDIGAYEYRESATPSPRAGASLTLSKNSLRGGETFAVVIDRGPQGVGEWVGIYQPEVADNGRVFEGSWEFLSGGKSVPSSRPSYPVRLQLAAPTTPGTYELRYYGSPDHSQKLAEKSFTVLPATSSASLTLSKNSLRSGETFAVVIDGGPQGVGEWVGIYRPEVADNGRVFEGNWEFLSGGKSVPSSRPSYPVRLQLTAPTTPGTYELRYYGSPDHSQKLAEKTFTVLRAKIVLEAETLALTGYRVELTGVASGSALIKLSAQRDGRATATFSGPSGRYQVVLNYFDENDGRGTIGVAVAGRPAGSVLLDQGRDSPVATRANRRRTALNIVNLSPGDQIEIVGRFDRSESCRLDSIELHPR